MDGKHASPNETAWNEILLDEDKESLQRSLEIADQASFMGIFANEKIARNPVQEITKEIGREDVAKKIANAVYQISLLEGLEQSNGMEISISEGLEAMGALLGNERYIQGKERLQEVAFAVRFYELSTKQTEHPEMKGRLLTTLGWLRAATLARNSLDNENADLVVSKDVVVNAVQNDATWLEMAFKDLTADNNYKFNILYDTLVGCGKNIIEGVEEFEKHTDWYDLDLKGY